MAATPATDFGTQMTALKNNSGGAVQALLPNNQVEGKERVFIENLVLNSQASGHVIAIARVPLGSIFLGVSVCTDTSLGSSTLAMGDAGDGNAAIFGAAKTLTALDTPTGWAKTASYGAPINTGYDCISGAAVTPFAPGQGGGAYEDITATVGTANLPAAGNVVFVTRYIPPGM